MWTRGFNAYGQLGNGSYTDSSTPVQVSGLSGIKAVDVNVYHSAALKSNGTAWAWGLNIYGQLGDGTVNDRPTLCEHPPARARLRC